MKKNAFTLMLMLLLWTDVSHAVSDYVQIPLIVIDDTRTGSSTTRRSMVLFPLECYYDSISHEVVVSFLEPLGNVNIKLVNISTGEMYSTIMSSSDNGLCIIPISVESGSYLIFFYYDIGKCYEGEFNVE